MAVASKNRHNAAFVVGSVIGAVAGAAVALWKTPYSGEELRTKLTGAGAHEGIESQTYVAPGATTVTPTGGERSIKDKVLAGVEKTLAPIVGVELGKTANDGGSTTLDSGDMKVNPEYGSTMLRHPHAWTDGGEATTATGAESTKLGLSRDKVDAEKWAAAYGTSANTSATTPAAPTTPSTPAASTSPATEPATSETGSSEYGTTLLRHPHAWTDGSEAATGTGAESTKLGLSRDKVDPEKWAAAYSGTEDTTMTKQAEGSSDQGDARLRPQRSWGDTGETRVSPDATTSSTGGYVSKAAESEAQTGLGAKPAYPGNDQTGHAPVDRTAPDSNVAEVGGRADNIRTDSGLTSEDAASVDSLTKPQTDRIPDSMRTPDEGSYHPFPQLGGKES